MGTQKVHRPHKKWMRLDNAALIYPAVQNRKWMAMFRLSAELTDPVDPKSLNDALISTLRRFPFFAVTLRNGLFWHYLEQNTVQPKVEEDVANPFVRLNYSKSNPYLFRVRYYNKKISIEFFHVLTDGGGSMRFFKTLLAEYLYIKYGAIIPRGDEIADCGEPYSEEEIEDAFHKYSRGIVKSRSEAAAFSMRGTMEPRHLVHITSGIMDSAELLRLAREKNVTLTAYLTAVLIMAFDKLQRLEGLPQKKLKPVKVCVPVNLRGFYPSRTMRNFSQYVNPGIEPRLGVYTFDEVVQLVHHFLKYEITEKNLNARFAKNVLDSSFPIVRVMPLFIKNAILSMVYRRVGDNLTTSTISSLGIVKLPDVMSDFIPKFEAVIGPFFRNPVICAFLSYKDKTYINFTRSIKESDVEREFFTFLVKQGAHVLIESNSLSDKISI